MTRYLICGGRDWGDYDMLDRCLRNLILNPQRATVIHGGARGVDVMAGAWAKANRVSQIVEVKADWQEHGRAAGPIRNKRMLDEQKPDVVIAFPGGKGTANMLRQATALQNERNASGGPPLVVIQVTT